VPALRVAGAMKSWRDAAMAVIARVQRENPDARGDDLRKLLKAAYPFGQRAYHPYKIWLDCVNQVCGKRARPLDHLPLFGARVD